MTSTPNTQPDWAVDPALAADSCGSFIRDTLAAAGYQRLVVGLSGGIDSAVAAGLAVQAIGVDAVLGVMMPYRTSNPDSLADAQVVADYLGIATETVEITSMVDAFLQGMPDADPVRRGNLMARCRMMVLYDLSSRDQRLVLGTGNRTEALLGYTTLYGDNACALNPIGQLYKTEVRGLAAWLKLPEIVLRKAPSADLWQGQTDEQELGFTYAQVDPLLHHLVDQGLQKRQLEALGHPADLITLVRDRVQAMVFKRLLPPSAVIGGRVDPDGGSWPFAGTVSGGGQR